MTFQDIVAALPTLSMLLCAILPLLRGVKVYSLFMDGALEGIKSAISVLPALTAMMVALKILGVLPFWQSISGAISPIFVPLGLPTLVLPLVFLRPFTGAGALGVLGSIFDTAGVDSATGRVASAIMGSTETYFYTAALYYAAAKRSPQKGILWRASLCYAVAILLSVLLTNWMR